MFLKIPIPIVGAHRARGSRPASRRLPGSALAGALAAAAIALVLNGSPVSAQGLSGISHRDKLYDMVIRGNELFAVGFPGLVLHSADRGESWRLIDIGSSEALFAIDVSADGLGIIVGRSGLVLTTADGGKSWKRQKSGTEEHLFDVALLQGGKAWAVGHFGTIIHSTDGGESWSAQPYDASIPTVIDEEGKETQAQICVAEMENEGAVEEARLNAVSFVDDQRGWIGGEFGLVLHTEDGGKSWKRQVNAAGKLLFSLRALDAERAMAVGVEGNMIETRDGGKSWTVVNAGVKEHLLDVWQAGDKCYAVGRDGVVLMRKGPDQAFERLDLGIYAWLGTVRFVDDNLGFVAGGRGSLLKTTNAGAKWLRLSPEGR